MATTQRQLVWLGAGTARKPDLSFKDFSNVTLIDARTQACLELKRHCKGANVQVLEQLITDKTAQLTFNHYSVPEFSAVAATKLLQKLFPGLKNTRQEQLQSFAVTELIQSLILSQQLATTTNTLVLDVPDQNFSILKALISSQQISLFDTVYLQYSEIELYLGMPTLQAVTELLTQNFYVLKSIDNSDPDLPLYLFKQNIEAKNNAELKQQIYCLNQEIETLKKNETNYRKQAESTINSLKSQVQSLKDERELLLASSTKQQAELKQQLAEKQRQNDNFQQLLTKVEQQAVLGEQQRQQQQQNANQQITDLTAKLEQTKASYEQAQKHASNRLKKIAELEDVNHQLDLINMQLNQRQQFIEKELLKAEAQVELIKMLLQKSLEG